MKREKIKVEKRNIVGKKVRKLRREGLLPVTIYGKGFKSVSGQVPLKEFSALFKKVGETGLVDVALEEQVLPVLIHNAQLEPRSQEILHADLYKVDLKQKIRAKIPVEATGEAPAVLDGKGLLLHQLSEIEVEALPTDLPEKFEVSLTGLKELNDEITVSQIKVTDDITILTESAQVVFKIGELVSKEAEEQAKEEEKAAEEAKTTPAEEAGKTEPGQPEAKATEEKTAKQEPAKE